MCVSTVGHKVGTINVYDGDVTIKIAMMTTGCVCICLIATVFPDVQSRSKVGIVFLHNGICIHFVLQQQWKNSLLIFVQ